MLKQNYDRAVRLCSRSIEEGFDLTPSHAAEEKLPFDAVYSLRRQMFSRLNMLDRPQVHFVVVSDGYPRQPTLEPLEYELLPRELEFETCGRALVHHMNFQHMHIRKIDWRCKQRTDEFLKQYRDGYSIVDIARQPGLRYSPYLMSRIIVGMLVPGTPVAQLMRTPSLITDERLRKEVESCVSEDRDYSPYMDRVRRGLGSEYEFVLQQKLRARGVAFESESDLREKGAYKTPDMLLQVPVAVKGPNDEWLVVSWIDSKAMFGDEHTFVQEHQSQLLSYVNRYGPGLVIYWFGFVETLLSPSFDGYKKDIMVAEDFPSPIMLPTGQLV